MAYRPRGTLARTLFNKIHNDQYLEGYDMKLVSTQMPAFPSFTPINLFNFIFAVVHLVETIARAIPVEIFATGKTG